MSVVETDCASDVAVEVGGGADVCAVSADPGPGDSAAVAGPANTDRTIIKVNNIAPNLFDDETRLDI